MKHLAVAVLALAILVSAVIIGLSPARADHDNTLYANWGCPTADGPIDIARAWELDAAASVTPIALAHDCIVFPMSLAIEPVRFIKKVSDVDGSYAFVWEVRLVGDVDTFFTNFDEPSHILLSRELTNL